MVKRPSINAIKGVGRSKSGETMSLPYNQSMLQFAIDDPSKQALHSPVWNINIDTRGVIRYPFQP